MSNFEILLSVGEAVLPLVMFVNGFSLGYCVADDIREWSEARREKKKAAAIKNTLPSHEDAGSKQETKSNP